MLELGAPVMLLLGSRDLAVSVLVFLVVQRCGHGGLKLAGGSCMDSLSTEIVSLLEHCNMGSPALADRVGVNAETQSIGLDQRPRHD